MPRLVYLAPLVTALLVACRSPTETPTAALAGAWHTVVNPLNGGMWLSLEATGTSATGTYGIVSEGGRVRGTVTGQAVNNIVSLTFQDSTGTVARYVGWIVGHDQLQGAWSQSPGSSSDLTFFRQ